MEWKKLGKALLFPHIAVMLLLIPCAAVFLGYSMVYLSADSVIAIVSYVLSAYMLTVWCFRIKSVIEFFKRFKEENPYAKRWREDERLRVNVSLLGSLTLNVAYAALQLWLGITHKSFWFYSFAVYYIILAAMRFFLIRHTALHKPGEMMKKELITYRACGWIFLTINLELSLMVFFMIYWDRTFEHNEITTIAMAAYTFAAFAVAVVNIVKYKKYNNPIYSASKAISLAAASVSILTLESTMLTTFSAGTMDAFSRKMLLGASGGAIAVFIIVTAIYMITSSTNKLKLLKTEEN